MDNNFENGYYGGEPQRPFTEKQGAQPQQGAQPPQQNPAFGFDPQKPLMQQKEQQAQQQIPQAQQQMPRTQAQQPQRPPMPQMQQPRMPRQMPQQPQMQRPQMPQQMPKPPAVPQQPADQGFDPIEHTAMYQDGEFRANRQAPPQQDPGAQPPYGAPQNTDYSQPSYYNPAANQQEVHPTQITPLSNPYESHDRTPAPPAEPKKKGNKGLIAIIIVLAVLLAASFTGMLIFAFSQSKGTEPAGSEYGNPNGFGNPGGFGNGEQFTMPGGGSNQTPFFGQQQEQQPTTEAIEHSESDYSDKTDKDYKGLGLGAKPSDAKTNTSYGAEYAYEKVSPSVVGVLGYTDNDKKVKGSEGSGIIISEDGYVITNAHVINNSKTSLALYVITADGKEYKAGVVGFDSRTDIALLKLDGASGLTAATFGNSDSLELGEDIIIVGNPGGVSFQNSMTKGIVSALDRDASKKSIVKYIQTDAAINPGNSGGPAVNMFGQVIGIATSKIVDEKYEGMGFCIPSATAKTIVDSLMKNGYVEGRVKIGISGTAVSAAEAEMYGIPTGIMVDSVDSEGPCGKVGIKADDIITEADGQTITSFSDIYNVLEGHKAGDKIKLKYSSYNNGTYTEKEAEVTLAADEG